MVNQHQNQFCFKFVKPRDDFFLLGDFSQANLEWQNEFLFLYLYIFVIVNDLSKSLIENSSLELLLKQKIDFLTSHP